MRGRGSNAGSNIRTLRRGATTQLPADQQEAYNLLLEYAVQGKHHVISQLLDKHYRAGSAVAARGNAVAARGSAVAARGSAVAARGSAVAACGSAVAARGSAVAARGNGTSDRGGEPAGGSGGSPATERCYFDVNTTQNRHVRSLLHMSVGAEQFKVTKTLLKYGADPNLPDKQGLTALHIAARKPTCELLQVLLENGGYPDLPDLEGMLPLHWAAACGTLNCVKFLLPRTNNINSVDKQGRTIVHMAARNGHVAVLDYLFTSKYRKQVAVDVQDTSQETALTLAICKGHVVCVDLLLSHGVATTTTLTHLSQDKETPLQLCLNKLMFPQAAQISREYDNFMKVLELPIEEGKISYLTMKQFIEHLFNENRDEAWDLWTDLRNVVIDCAKELVDCTRTIESFPLLVKLLKHLRSLGVMSVEPQLNRRPVLKRMISFSPQTPEQEEKLLVHRKIEIETENICSYGEPSRVDAFAALDDVWKFLYKWMTLVKSYHSRTTTHQTYRFMRRPYELDANDLRDIAPRVCSLIKGYHIWSEGTVHYKQFLDFVSEFASVLKLFLTFNTELIFEQLDFLLDSPIAMIEFQNIRSVMFDVPVELRKSWFYERLYQGTPPDNPDFLSEHLNMFVIDRENLFLTSCEQVMSSSTDTLQQSLTINFEGDDGMGVGVRREWFTLLVNRITDPSYGLFQGWNNGLNFQPSCLSKVNPDHLRHFEFAGKIIGMLIYYKNTTGVHFTKSFYKQMLGVPLDYTDVSDIDSDLASSLQWLIDNDVSDVDQLTFCIDLHEFGEPSVVNLKPGGADIPVSEENKLEYIRLLSEYKMCGAIKQQITSFLKGFYNIVPRKWLAIFSPAELELVLCGLNVVDRKDWRNHILYTGYTSEDPMIGWFWEILETFTQEQLITLLKFITGYSRVPHGGFSQFEVIGSSGPIKIVKGNGSANALPKSSVCFNMLMLPEYPSKEVLQSRLQMAMAYASVGFDLC